MFKVKYTSINYDLPSQWEKAITIDVLSPIFSPEDEKYQNDDKILVVLDKIVHDDITNSRLLANECSGRVFRNVLERMLTVEKHKFGKLMVVCYNFLNLKNIPQSARRQVHSVNHDRIQSIIKSWKPDKVMLVGKQPTLALYPRKFRSSKNKKFEVDPLLQVGRMNPCKYRGFKTKVISTYSLSMMAADDDPSYDGLKRFPNLLGQFYYHFDTLLHGDNRYTLDMSEFKVIPIDTLAKFKSWYKKKLCRPNQRISVDTETANLNIHANTLLTIQFAFNGHTAYSIPIDHKETPFNEKEILYIKKKLCHFFERGESEFLIFCFAKFDLKQIIRRLNVRFVNHKIYDLPSGKMSLDENVKFLQGLVNKIWGLDTMTLEAGSYTYIEPGGDLKKEDREDMANQPLKKIHRYGGKDVVIPWQICHFQIAEAERRGKDYNLYLPSMLDQIGAQLHDFAEMESNGVYIDTDYLLKQMSPNSDIRAVLDNVQNKLKESKAARKANKILFKESGQPENALWGTADNWILDIGKPKHQQMLFINILGLEGLEERKDGNGFKIDKAFQNHHADVPEIKLFKEYQEAKKLESTFIVGFFKKVSTHPDSIIDRCLRSDFIHLDIITGRSGARKPSMQQIPTRAKISKIVKRQFIAPFGFMLIKADYSAHEVRNWGIIAGDDVISAAFAVGLKYRHIYRLLKRIDDGIRQEYTKIFEANDIHRINYKFFYGRPVDQKDPDKAKAERNSIKQVVFGVIYGKGPDSLAEDIGGTREEAQKLIDLLFEKFERGGDWITSIHKMGRKNLRVSSSFGRVRHLWGYLHPSRQVHGMMDRRGPNSLIQGPASYEGFMGGRSMSQMKWDFFVSKGQPFSFETSNKVHDCVAEGTLIHTTQGLIPIEKLCNESKTGVYDVDFTVGSRYKIEKVHKFINRGIRPTLDIQTHFGPTLSCTPNHKLLVFDGISCEWKKSQEIKVDDYLCINPQRTVRKEPLSLNLVPYTHSQQPNTKWMRKLTYRVKIPRQMTPDLAFVLGLIISEGSISGNAIHVYNSNKKLLDKYESSFDKVFGLKPKRYLNVKKGRKLQFKDKTRSYTLTTSKDCYSSEISSRELMDYLNQMGLFQTFKKNGKGVAHHKEIPWSILQADEKSQLSFLAAYIEGDGYYSPIGETEIHSYSNSVCKNLQQILLSHGYLAKLNETSIWLNLVDTKNLWSKIRKYHVSKKPKINSRTSRRMNFGVPTFAFQVRLPNIKMPDLLLYDQHYRGKYSELLGEIKKADKNLYQKISILLKDRHYFSQVDKINVGKKRKVYDLTIKRGEPAYLANGIVSHNSTENRTKIIELPISLYMMEHAYTTKVHQICKEKFNLKMNVSLEMEMDIGGSLATMDGWDYSLDQLLTLTEKHIEWMKSDLKYDLNTAKLMKKVEHNAIICNKLRRKELKQSIDLKRKANLYMEMNAENALDLDLKFADPFQG